MQRISFDHLIGASHQRWREGEAECFGCLDVYNQLELNALLDGRVARELGPSVKMISCYEAGYDGFWLHRLLERHGVRNHVIDPASLQVDRRIRRAKTDRIDAARLLRSLMAHLRRGRSRTDGRGDGLLQLGAEERDHEVSILMSRTDAVVRY